ncbi:MAG: hypothetical protein M1823_002555 [Watsoniomyces obsoletus]|nr:MAG: hypothetical protein M1823_002555 [Watsoniomyces obsoletus]
MRHRPPDAPRSTRTSLLAVVGLITLAVAAQQQQQWQHSTSRPGDAVASPEQSHLNHLTVETPRKAFKSTVISSDASAVTTLAPASLGPAVRAPPAHPSGTSAGLSAPVSVRSLQDWEVEDLVLLATVDGTIHARDRKTGVARWALEVDRPMVDVVNHRRNTSESNESRPEDQLIWIVEPSKDGSLYVYTTGPNPGIQRLGLTVRKLVEELSPYASEDPPVVYTAEKKNTLYTVDAGTGRVLKMFSAGGSSINDENSCRRVTGLEALDDEACGSSGTLTLGRTEYIVAIQSKDTGEPICTLRYSEWGPNNRDGDLEGQYVSTMDQKYIYSRHDGSVFGIDHTRRPNDRHLYAHKMSTPVARVFDVARPANLDARDASLVVLPQPVGPADTDELLLRVRNRDSRVFVNRTEEGGWYALSEMAYPLVTGGAAPAPCYRDDWQQKGQRSDEIENLQKSGALVGVHSIINQPRRTYSFPAISAPEVDNTNETPIDHAREQLSLPSTPAIANSRLLGYAAQNAVDIGILLPILIGVMFLYVNRRKLAKIVVKTLDVEKIPGVKDVLTSPPPTPAVVDRSFAAAIDEALGTNSPDDEDEGTKTPTEPKTVSLSTIVEEGARDEDVAVENLDGAVSPQPKKKKTHRGQRGGVGRKKGKKDTVASKAVDEIVEEVKEINREPGLEPDVVHVTSSGSGGITDVTGNFQINNLVVTDSILGFGSHGTVVYKGSFEGREVAVKRMLLEFYDVAAHEVGLLQESDDHPNVIRYFCRQQSAGFLYIALELCPASLQDVIEKPNDFPSLAQASLLDLPNVLFQIAAGVRYLHSLKIVHRDLKPQNILVAPPKVSRSNPKATLPPRLLISDFGLCKKLEGDQSSFRATTAHAAGTSGWRAPELLVDDDAGPSTNGASESGHSLENSEPAVIDTLSNRRATRAIDIFSLGCVFFYILSRGSHPFGDRYMREANIVRGQYNLDQLQGLADYGYEAEALIESMLDPDPRRRPDATTVMIHPLFWSPEKRLSFLCDVSDHFEWEPRDPPSADLQTLESTAPQVLGTDFLRRLDRAFVDTLGKQRKYTGSKMLDLLRALRNKKNHYQDMPEHVKAHVGPLPEGYLQYWAVRFPTLLLQCYYVVVQCRLEGLPRFKAYFSPPQT